MSPAPPKRVPLLTRWTGDGESYTGEGDPAASGQQREPLFLAIGINIRRSDSEKPRGERRIPLPSPPSIMSSPKPELEFWVQRTCRFHNTTEEALQVLRDDLNHRTFIEVYEKEAEWRAGADKNPCAVFPLNDPVQQEVYFQAVEDMCDSVDRVPKDDYPAYAPG